MYKICGSTRASGTGFGDRLDSALGEIEKGVGSGNSGFYAGAYQSVYVLGQCEGDLSSGDCVKCVKSVVDRAKSECGLCGESLSAQIYLQQCYITYTYYPNGVPTKSNQPSSFSPSGVPQFQSWTRRRNPGRLQLKRCLRFIFSISIQSVATISLLFAEMGEKNMRGNIFAGNSSQHRHGETRARKESREDGCNCAGRISWCKIGSGLFVVH